MFWLCGAQLRLWGEETPNLAGIKFSKRADIDDLITRTHFGDDQLRGIGVAKSEIAVFSLTTLTLRASVLYISSNVAYIHIDTASSRFLRRTVLSKLFA